MATAIIAAAMSRRWTVPILLLPGLIDVMPRVSVQIMEDREYRGRKITCVLSGFQLRVHIRRFSHCCHRDNRDRETPASNARGDVSWRCEPSNSHDEPRSLSSRDSAGRSMAVLLAPRRHDESTPAGIRRPQRAHSGRTAGDHQTPTPSRHDRFRHYRRLPNSPGLE